MTTIANMIDCECCDYGADYRQHPTDTDTELKQTKKQYTEFCPL